MFLADDDVWVECITPPNKSYYKMSLLLYHSLRKSEEKWNLYGLKIAGGNCIKVYPRGLIAKIHLHKLIHLKITR